MFGQSIAFGLLAFAYVGAVVLLARWVTRVLGDDEGEG